MKKAILVVLAAFGLKIASALATPITVPTALNPGDQYRLAFVTSTTRDATSTNIADYNRHVTNAANGVQELVDLGTTWTAIVSTATVDARTNTHTDPTPIGNTGVPIFLLNDTILSDHYDDFWDGSIDNSFGITELGTASTAVLHTVWTGTSSLGFAIPSNELGTLSGFIGVGQDNTLSFSWVDTGLSPTDGPPAKRPLYALSAVLTVTNIPEPATLAILALGLVGMCAMRRRRQGAENLA